LIAECYSAKHNQLTSDRLESGLCGDWHCQVLVGVLLGRLADIDFIAKLSLALAVALVEFGKISLVIKKKSGMRRRQTK
jgi:hypothetical protein